MLWVEKYVASLARYVMGLTPDQRSMVSLGLQRDWPTSLFERLVSAVVDVADAAVVHIEDNADISAANDFWHVIALLQLLSLANDANEHVIMEGLETIGEGESPKVPRSAEGDKYLMGPRLHTERFVLRGTLTLTLTLIGGSTRRDSC